ncbi:DegT/DnrJ/EryC1/StrS family aminotransferase [Bacteroidota bacterium]
MIGLYPGFPKSLSKKPNTNFFDDLETYLGLKVYPFSSARAAMVFSLRALGFERIDEVLVPPFLSDCVISAISKTAFPVIVPTPKTRAIYVFHQFGFPQDIEEIESRAAQKGWIIINCCVHSPFTKHHGKWLMEWGDFTIFSLPKFYPCGLGGGLITKNKKIVKVLEKEYVNMFKLQAKWADQAYSILSNANKSSGKMDSRFKIESVYGYLPNTVTFPSSSFNGLPSDILSIKKDIVRRKKLFRLAEQYLPDIFQGNVSSDIVPFALPLKISQNKVHSIKYNLSVEFNLQATLLHFDHNQNMLNANYEKAFVLGCHESWDNKIFENLNKA